MIQQPDLPHWRLTQRGLVEPSGGLVGWGQRGDPGVIMCAVDHPQTLLTTTKAVRVSLLDDAARVESLTVLSGFRTDFTAV
jgi:hypothetical protein